MNCLRPRRAFTYGTLAFGLLLSPFSARANTIFSITDYGASGADLHKDTVAIQKAIDACSAAGGGQVVVPAGQTYTVATLVLKSHVDLHLEPGSVLKGSPNNKDFTQFSHPPVAFGADPVPRMGVIIYADGAEDISITGTGRIDGNGMAYVTKINPTIYTCVDERPFAMLLKSCSRVTLRDFTLKNSAFWTLRLLGCDDATLESLHIDGDLLMPNNDGIDIDWSSNVRVLGCNISTGDDCISLKTAPLNEGVDRPCENIVISNCTLRSRSSGIVLGCDASGPIRNVVASNCVISDSHRGVAVRLSLGGTIEHALFENMVIETRIFDSKWWGRGEPIQVLALPWHTDSKLGKIRDLNFSNLTCVSENGAVVVAEEPGHIENVTFDRVKITINRPRDTPGGQQDYRPNDTAPMPTTGTSGFLLSHAAGVVFRDCSVTWGPNPPDTFLHVLDATACPGLVPDGLDGDAPKAGTARTLIR